MTLDDKTHLVAMNIAPFSFSTMAEMVIGQFASLFEEKGYIIQTNIQPDILCLGDESQLSRVLYNLINKALTHAGDDKIVIVRSYSRDDVVSTEVEDHGAGIPRDVLPHV